MIFLCTLLPFFVFAQQRTPAKALKECKQLETLSYTKGEPQYKLFATSSSLSSLKGIGKNNEAYYIYADSSDGKGFVIVSGDERMPKILAYSDENRFNTANMPPALKFWLDCYVEEYLNLQKDPQIPSVALSDVRPEGVEPLLGGIRWDQDEPYNNLCPTSSRGKCLTGCVATAMAQVMKYHQFPNQGRGRKSYFYGEFNQKRITHDFSDDYFRWDKMLDAYTGNYTNEQAEAVATLMYSCGVSVEMSYGTSSSGAYQHDLLHGYVENFGYDADASCLLRDYISTEDWHQLLIEELNNGRPVNYGGSEPNSDSGHSFVFDGYKTGVNPYPDYHVNWGWSGEGDGYYQLANLSPRLNNGTPYNSGFISGQQMAIGVKPDDGINSHHSYLCVDNLRISQATIKRGAKISVYVSECINMSYKDFIGSLQLFLINNDGREFLLGQHDVGRINYYDLTENLNFQVSIPDDLPEGKYIVKMKSKQDDGTEWFDVYSNGNPTLTVSDNPVIIPESLFACSGVNFFESPDSSLLAANVYELQNLTRSFFAGGLKFALSTDDGRFIQFLNDSAQSVVVDVMRPVSSPVKLYGAIPDSIPNGSYRLYIAFEKSESSEFGYVAYRNWATSYMEPTEYYFEVSVSEGKAMIDGHVYDLQPTSVSVGLNAITELIDRYLSGDKSVLLDDIVKLIDKYLSQE